MYAIIEDSGQQFKVTQGDVIRVDLRELAEDEKQITFNRVLLISGEGDSDRKIGTPVVENAKVVGDVVNPLLKGEKIHIVKYRRRKGYRRHQGHRQKYIEVKIAEIVA